MIVIIMLGSVFLIYNAFNISLNENARSRSAFSPPPGLRRHSSKMRCSLRDFASARLVFQSAF